MKDAASGPRYLTKLEITACLLSSLCRKRKGKAFANIVNSITALHFCIAHCTIPHLVTKCKLVERTSSSQFGLLKHDPHMLRVKLLHMVGHVHVCWAPGKMRQIKRKHSQSCNLSNIPFKHNALLLLSISSALKIC